LNLACNLPSLIPQQVLEQQPGRVQEPVLLKELLQVQEQQMGMGRPGWSLYRGKQAQELQAQQLKELELKEMELALEQRRSRMMKSRTNRQHCTWVQLGP